MMDHRTPHPLMSAARVNQGRPSTSISVFDATSGTSITASRQPKGPPSIANMGFNALRQVSMSFGPKDRVEMGMPSCDTMFFALSRRVSPIAHLQALRGAQDEPLLHTDEFMSPGLHNSSDTYHRLLRSQLCYRHELSQGRHQRQWLKKIKERKSFMDFTSHLEHHSYPFLHGFHIQIQKEEDERFSYEEGKEDYLLRESEGMQRRGWAPEDWGKIQRALVQENMMAEREMDLDRSYDSIETTVPSVFDDNEEYEDTDDGDDFDHIYSFDDGKPAARQTSDDEPTIQEVADLEQEMQPVIASAEVTSIQQTTKVQLDTESSKNYISSNHRLAFSINTIEQYYQAKIPLIDMSLEYLVERSRDEIAKQNRPSEKQKLDCKESFAEAMGFISTDDTNYQDADAEPSTFSGGLYQIPNQSLADQLTSSDPFVATPFDLSCSDDESSDDESNEDESNDGEDENDDEEDSEEEDSEDDEESDDEGVSTATNSAPSRLLASLFCLGGNGSDSDEEEDNEEHGDETLSCSRSPPASLYLDLPAILDTESEVGNIELSPAHRRQLEFLTDLKSVRTQAKLDMEAEAERKVIKDAHKRCKHELSCPTSNLAVHLVSLRLHMFSNNLFPINQQEKVHFKCNKSVGKHEVEFKGALRRDLMDKRETRLGGIVERAFWDAKKNGDWAREMDNDKSYALIRDASHLAAMIGESETFKNDMKEVVGMTQQIQYAVQCRARQAIEHAIWADNKVLGIEIAEESDTEICWDE